MGKMKATDLNKDTNIDERSCLLQNPNEVQGWIQNFGKQVGEVGGGEKLSVK